MSEGVGITGDQATLLAPLTSAAMQQLKSSRPTRIELIGDWSDLTPLSAIAEGVEHLYIAGDLETGKIRGVDGLAAFTSLTKLRLASAVKGGYDLDRLPLLEQLEVVWQAETAAAFRHPTLRVLTLKAFSAPDLSAIEVSPHSRLERLWFASPKLVSLAGIDRVSSLRELRITDARKLVSLQGMTLPTLASLDIENASLLSDVSAVLAASSALEGLRLTSIAAVADLSMVLRLPALRRLQVGGRSAPQIDWLALMRLPSLRNAFAWWDPDDVSEAALRGAAEGAGRDVLRFEPVPGRGRRPLLVELG